MGERTSHKPGTVSWADLSTSDPEGAKSFYSALMGWEIEDLPAGEGMVYSMARLGGRDAAAITGGRMGEPPHWNVYVTVESAGDAAAKARELGGNIVMGPFDVFDSGRMAVLQDPTGAFVMAWEPRQSIGAEVVNVAGALTWADLITPDPESSKSFYGEWLGWTFQEMPESGGYNVIFNGERANGGVLPRRPEMGDIPPAWMPYFGTADLDAGVARVGELGGHVLSPPQQVPQGRFAVVADPQGAAFSIWAGEFDD
jgi:predicted enzyme related to lactoylglutathione lyase